MNRPHPSFRVTCGLHSTHGNQRGTMSVITVCTLVMVIMTLTQAQFDDALSLEGHALPLELPEYQINPEGGAATLNENLAANLTVEQQLVKIRSVLGSHGRRIERLRRRMIKMRKRCCRRRGGTGGGTGGGTDPDTHVRRPHSCADVKTYDNTNSVHKIVINHNKILVFCDQKTAGGGWTVIQRRMGGQTNFRQNYTVYQAGFGHLRREFFLGLDKIYRITSYRPHKLRIDMEDFNGTKAFAEYTSFSIGSADDYYRLNVTGYNANSTAGNSLSYHNLAPFSTFDNDQDGQAGKNCAGVYGGGGWYTGPDCYRANLNGQYKNATEDASDGVGVIWLTFKNRFISLKKVEMKIRRYSRQA